MAFDIKTSKMLNDSRTGNFVFTPTKNICNVQIFDEITMKTCGELIGNMAQIIGQLPVQQPIINASDRIVSPYDISPDKFVFDVIINSPGGEFGAYKSIAAMFSLAKAKGAIIRTNNIAMACSAASLLAVQGTIGYRIMSESAYNLVHYGRSHISGSRENELEIATKNSTKDRKQVFHIYEKYTKLSATELEKYKSIELSGQLFAHRCLTKHLCDWILTSDGVLIGRKQR